MASIHANLPSMHEVLSPSQRTVLLVEDNPADADLVRQLIAPRDDLKLHTAANGRQGIEMASSLQPDLILMDMKMPGVSGLDALFILRGNPATSHIPLIVLSANAYPRRIKECLEAGAFQYVTKPYRIENLLAVIDTALQRVEECCPTLKRGTATTEAATHNLFSRYPAPEGCNVAQTLSIQCDAALDGLRRL